MIVFPKIGVRSFRWRAPAAVVRPCCAHGWSVFSSDGGLMAPPRRVRDRARRFPCALFSFRQPMKTAVLVHRC